MSTPAGSGSGSGIVVQVPINVTLPTYDWNAPDQMRENSTVQASIHILEEDLLDHVR